MTRNNADFQGGQQIPEDVLNWRKETRIGHKRSLKRAIELHTHIGAESFGTSLQGQSYAHALQQEHRENSKVNQVPLYRGGTSNNSSNNLGLVSFTESRDVAEKFAKSTGGKVFVAHPGTVRGLRVNDYLGDGNMWGSESEWLVHESHAKNAKPLS